MRHGGLRGRAGSRRAARLGRALALPFLLLAVLLQADAVVKSTVMNLVGMAPAAAGAAPVCSPAMGAMAGASQAHAAGRTEPAHGDRAVCSYCAAAAHAATLSFMPPVQPSCAVSFAAFLQTSVHGPRGPPSIPPRARGPPLSA